MPQFWRDVLILWKVQIIGMCGAYCALDHAPFPVDDGHDPNTASLQQRNVDDEYTRE